MTTYVALLRAVNVGGTGKLPMSDLVAICERIGFLRARTYIASGNVVFDSSLAEKHVKRRLEAELESYAKKPVGVIVRTAAQMAAVLAANPLSKAVPNRTVAIFLDTAPSPAMLRGMTGVKSETARLGVREIYVQLSRRHRGVEAQDSRRRGGHSTQHEHHCQARPDSGGRPGQGSTKELTGVQK